MPSAPDPRDFVSSLVLESGKAWGDVATDFQWDDLNAIFPYREERRLQFLTRPRGGSKSTDLAGDALAWLACEAVPGAQGYIAAVDMDQASLVLDAADGFVSRTPGLKSLITVETTKIVCASGAEFIALATEGSSAFGLRPHFVIVDEIAQWPGTRNARRMWTALFSAIDKVRDENGRPMCRLVCMTSAGEPEHWSKKILDNARKSARWRTSEVPGPLPWLTPDDLNEQRLVLTESQFARLHLNIWTAAEDRLLTEEDLSAAATLDPDRPEPPRPGVKYVVTLDLGLVNDRTVATVAHLEPDPHVPNGTKVIIDKLARWKGSRANPVSLGPIEEWIYTESLRYNLAEVWVDPWQAVDMIQRLQSRGIPIDKFEFTSASVGRMGQALHLAFRNRRITIPKDPELLQELLKVRLKETSPGVVRLDHDKGEHDDHAVAIGLAVVMLTGQPAPASPVIYSAEELAAMKPPMDRAEGHLLPVVAGKFAGSLSNGAELSEPQLESLPPGYQPPLPFDIHRLQGSPSPFVSP